MSRQPKRDFGSAFADPTSTLGLFGVLKAIPELDEWRSMHGDRAAQNRLHTVICGDTFLSNAMARQRNKKTKTNVVKSDRVSALVQKQKRRKSKRVSGFLLAQVEPFDQNASGAKIPDRNTMPSVTQRFRGVFSATTDGSGRYATAFRPYAARAQYLPLNVTGGTITWSGGTAVSLTPAASMESQYSLVRTVAYGLRVKFNGNRTGSAGVMHIACVGANYDMDPDSHNYYPTTPAQFENCPWYANYSLNELTEQEIVIPGRRCDEGSFRYRHPAVTPYGTTATQNGDIETSDGWGHIVIMIDGAVASSTVCNIEVVYHWEALLKPSGGSLIAPSPPALPAPNQLDAAMRASASMPLARYVDDGLNGIKKVISMISYGATTASHLVEAAGPIASAIGALL